MNFAEEMVYWYLRLNGFFVLQNFVLHRNDLTGTQNADVDLLAIRHRFTYEEVGGQPSDKDDALFSNFHLDKHVAIICEVKSGQNPSETSLSLNKEDRLKYALQRLGIFSTEKIKTKHLPKLAKESMTAGNHHQVVKLFISQKPVSYSSCLCLTLDHIELFLRNHLKKYIDEKSSARLFFNSELLQYMLWTINQETTRSCRPPGDLEATNYP